MIEQRKIEFKGMTAEREIVYGGVYQSHGQTFIVDNFQFIAVKWAVEWLGTDKHGRKVYELDRVIEPDGVERLLVYNKLTFAQDELKDD